MEQYYIKVDDDGQPIAVYRIVDNDVAFAEELWLDGDWVPTDRLTKYLIDGEINLNKATEEEALAVIKNLR